jgi:hypothetical protein
MNKSLTCFFNGTLLFLFFSCKDKTNETQEQSAVEMNDIKTEAQAMQNNNAAHSYFIKTFEVKNDAGTSEGWGYDIYIDSARTIHQPTIPAIEGIHSFKTKSDAERTGTFAMNKMKSSGSFPTLTMHELDSLGVLK